MFFFNFKTYHPYWETLYLKVTDSDLAVMPFYWRQKAVIRNYNKFCTKSKTNLEKMGFNYQNWQNAVQLMCQINSNKLNKLGNSNFS